MKKPTKKPQHIKEDSYLIGSYIEYTPDDLRNIADEMEKSNISWVSIEADEGTYTIQSRPETDKEAEVRYVRELKAWERFRKKEEERKIKAKERFIRDAKKYGLVIEEDTKK